MRRPPLPPWRAIADLAALALAAFCLAVAVPIALVRTARHVQLAVDRAHESADEVRAHLYGQAFADAVGVIRRTVPVDEPYLLIAENLPEEGAENWVRYELAPRRSVLIRGGERSARWLRQNVPSGIRWVVVTRGDDAPPSLYTRSDYFHHREGR